MAPAKNPELTRAVEISNRIRAIATYAFQMQLQAMNAVVLTRSRRVEVPGFEVVAIQMGRVSRDLVAMIAPLRAKVNAWIEVVSAQIRDLRELAILEDTRAVAGPEKLDPVMRPLRATLDARVEIERERRAFALAIEDLATIVATGCVLARTAKIEAVYGAGIVDVLGETAGAFTHLADTLDDSVRTIARWIGPARRTP